MVVFLKWCTIASQPILNLHQFLKNKDYCKIWDQEARLSRRSNIILLISLQKHKNHLVMIMSWVMRKPAFCIHENLNINVLHAADQCFCFHYIDSTRPLLPLSEISSLCGCTAWSVSDLLVNLENRFSHEEAQT